MGARCRRGQANDTCRAAGAGDHPGDGAVGVFLRGLAGVVVASPGASGPRRHGASSRSVRGWLCHAEPVTRRRAASLLAALATAAALTGCAGSPDDADAAGPAGTSAAGSSADLPSSSSATPSSSSSSSSSSPATAGTDRPDDGSSDAPAFPANTEPDSQDASADSFVTVRDIRTGRHDGFDRVVFEVAGTGTPGWDVRYVDQPSSQGSGDP